MRYRIRHRTRYDYSTPVFESFNEVRLQPLACDSQTVLEFDLAIDPPATVIGFRDYYENAVCDFAVPYLHDRLTIDATSDVVTHAAADEPLAGPVGEPDASPALAALQADSAFADELAEFLGPSAYVLLADASAPLARELVDADPEGSAYAFLERATAFVRQRLTYRLGSTTVESRVADALAGGSGVCQDFAHLLISLCRNVGLPARYVSGYLGGVADATASHAWAEAFVVPYGWLGMDATIGVPCTGQHVKLGVGRDYADVTVLRGTYQGGGQAALEVAVSCETLGTASSVAPAGGPGRRAGRLVSIENLGAVRRFQRDVAVGDSLLALTGSAVEGDERPLRAQRRADGSAPSQQPRQQQQPGAPR